MQSSFLEMWETHRDALRRLLLAWSRDGETADDLLQETYLRAKTGFGGYRGGDARSWLASIARNVWYTHCRQQRRDAGLPEEACGSEWAQAGSAWHVQQLAIRQAIDALPPTLHEALLLRHFGGLAYRDIAKRCGCPEGTARRRVWEALQQLKTALGVSKKEALKMGNHQLHGEDLLDYVYAALPSEDSARIQKRLHECPACCDEVREIKDVIDVLQAAEGNYILLHYVELAPDGSQICYAWSRFMNDPEQGLFLRSPGEEMRAFGFLNAPGFVTDYLILQGEEVPLDSRPWEEDPSRLFYTAQLPRPVPPGDSFDGMAVTRATNPADWATRLEGDRWRYSMQVGIGFQSAVAVLMLAIRLPVGAELLHASPQVTAVTGKHATTVRWRLSPAPQEPTDFVVEYRLNKEE